MSGKPPDTFVIRGSAAALERMGTVTAQRLYQSDEYGRVVGEVMLAQGVTVRRISTHVRDRLQQNLDEVAATAVGSLGTAGRERLRAMLLDALSARG